MGLSNLLCNSEFLGAVSRWKEILEIICWDLGRRPKIDGTVNTWDFILFMIGWCTYNWLTYQEVYGIQPSRLVPPFVLVASIQHHGNWGIWRKDLSKKKRLHSSTNWFFDKIKQASGGCVRLILFGAAPLPKHIEEFLRVTSCCVLSQGYGLTESCGGCSTSIANVFSMMGTVGVPMTTIGVRLESVPEMGYDASSVVPRGEICLRGTTLFSGYYKREDLTNEVLADGWFHTGDIGEWQPNEEMKIIDRKKKIFKLSQGEYVAVENIESVYSRCSLVTSWC
ncbi:putative CoA ligase CCL6 isoform X2 [Primulina tabacum]|uniref:putative CoA ligase CCL6 isoform X2 n=1 Tax=Primulina tabacum TaxID=48773 RepID=UPI003F5A1AED